MMFLLNLLKKECVFVFLIVFSFVAHFAFLSYPPEVVFDEFYFGQFSSAYLDREYYFDIHPPLGKLMIAGFASLSGSVNTGFDFEYVGKKAAPKLFFALRFLPALFGSFFVLLFSWFAYLATRSRKIAFVAGFLVLFDNAFLAQSKFALLDIFLLFFSVLALCFFLLCQRQRSFSKKWFIFLVLTAISFGLAVSIKWTGLAVIGVIGFILAGKVFSKEFADYLCEANYLVPEHQVTGSKKFKELFLSFLFVLTIGFIIYTVPFAVHFKLLAEADKGAEVQFPEKFIELNQRMLAANVGVTKLHPDGSRWFQWPFQQKHVVYWRANLSDQQDESQPRILDYWIPKIFFFGNPVVWLLSVIFVIITILFLVDVFLINRQKKKHRYVPVFSILIFGYFANLVPFVFVDRVTFLYHYLPALTFAILLTAIWLTTLINSKKVFAFTLILVVIGFVLIAPFTYGFPLPALDVLKNLQDYFVAPPNI